MILAHRGLTDESEILKFLQHGTLVGLLPVPHPILIRKYQANSGTTMWFRTYMWGVIYLRWVQLRSHILSEQLRMKERVVSCSGYTCNEKVCLCFCEWDIWGLLWESYWRHRFFYPSILGWLWRGTLLLSGLTDTSRNPWHCILQLAIDTFLLVSTEHSVDIWLYK